MNRRQFVLSSLAASLRAAPKQYNILFMVADDMNTELGCYGHPHVKSPNLDALARGGVRFERAYCQFPLCAPSRASFLSGRRPDTTRIFNLTTPTRMYMENVVMLPEFFRKAGYHSAQCGKIFHTGDEHVDPRSWDFMLPENGKNPPKSEILEEHAMPKPRNHSMAWEKLSTADAETPDGIIARTAIDQIRLAVSKQKPFFVAAGFRRPHSPYAVPKKYFDLYDPAKLKLPDPGNRKGFPPTAQYELENQVRLNDKEQREYMAAYYACNSYVDAQAGHVLRALDEMKLRDRTIVVFFGDHGYHTGQHGMWHKMTLFEEATHVPLIISTPGAKGAGRSVAGLVELVDLYPTLADACGRELPAGLEGVSLMPWMNDPAKPGKKAVYTMVGRNDDRNLSHKEPMYFGRTVRTERWRYTEWDSGKRGVELYDEAADSKEMVNMAGKPEAASALAEMKELLRRTR
jgi:iduronate 2-sulfatase